MKNLRIAVLFGIFLASLCFTTVKASTDNERKVLEDARQKAESNADALKQSVEDYYLRMTGAINDAMMPTTADYLDAYELYRFDDYIARTYHAENSLHSFLTAGTRLWIVPVTYQDIEYGHITIAETETGFEVLGGSRYDGGREISFSYDRLASILSLSGMAEFEISEFHVVRNMRYGADYVWLLAQSKEYIIPLDENFSEAGIRKHTVYSADEFVKILDTYYDEDGDERIHLEAAEKGEILFGGGVLSRESVKQMTRSSFNIWWIVIPANLIFLLLLILVFSIRRSKKTAAAA